MQKVNSIRKVLEPVGQVAGFFIALAGIFVLFSSYKGLVFVAPGLLLGFTSVAAYVDFNRKQYRFAIKLFGVIPVGKWLPFDSSLGLLINWANTVWRTYSSGNRSFDFPDGSYVIELVNESGKPLASIQRFKNLEGAKHAITFYSEQMAIPIRPTS